MGSGRLELLSSVRRCFSVTAGVEEMLFSRRLLPVSLAESGGG
jgi:hypothetical protein